MTPEPPADAAAALEADRQRRVLDFLDGSRFGTAKGGKRIDTHASVVFLDHDSVLKIKRAVRLSFLDYSTLKKRRRACEEELRVNAANAPELYRRVVAITRGNDGALEIDGAGTPVEWAVEMARFDEEQTLDRIGESNPIDPSLAVALAEAILQSHDKAPRANGESWLASIPSIIDRNTAKFRVVRGLEAAVIDQLDARSHDHASALRTLLSRRAAQGFVRRCHGDLHLANIALIDGKPLLFDAIEFDPVIATTDILYDLAFTLMDLIHFNNGSAANTLFNWYLAGASAENLDGLGALPLLLSMRAAIRAHVLFMKSERSANEEAAWGEAKRYFDLALRLITPNPPVLVAIGGLSGTGKSVLARSLAGMIEPPPGAVIVRSDVVRKLLFGVSETTALPAEAYRADASCRTYEALSNTAQRVLAQGASVILDASFMQEAQRTALFHLARERSVRFVGLFLTADLATRLARIAHREHDASDATRDVALKQETSAIGAMDWHVVDASGAPEDTLRRSAACVPEANCASANGGRLAYQA
ncbi:AAA family ATPase [Bradyrhizobium sp. Ash2021]|uniref:bifunctional aminoglycoside phosphotransferase/ATP-binding protein n=1 Tax=Bradyrhizobium sp. Ash2021 TaxID=2954771 RepID=UPI0028155225|nr:AAA family ATPase [Bradyrhizobium sp. Ash2021]WMT73445.1 AAA family ATPase [Bradyrhizobium sp. Ash2021]